MIHWNIDDEERKLIEQIVKRVAAPDEDHLELMMSMTACHLNDVPLDLQRMLDWEDNFDVMHDVYGINRNLSRETAKLQNCFLPRFARREILA